MESLCEFCGVVRAVVYCRSDTARLCLNCDGYVHSANVLSRRHLRSLICDNCNSQPAIVRCVEDKLSLCEGCDWTGSGCSGPGHQRQTLNYYSGCPSLEEFSRIWSSILGVSSLGGIDTGWGMSSTMSVNDNCISNCWVPGENEVSSGLMVANKLNALESCTKFEPHVDPSSVIPPNLNSIPFCGEQTPFLSDDSNHSKRECSSFKNLKICDGTDLCEGFSMNNDGLNFEDGDEIFSCSRSHPRYHFEDTGMDCLFLEKNLTVTESNGPNENATEASSSGVDCLAFQPCIAGLPNSIQAANGGADCVLLNPSGNNNISLSFPSGQVHSNMSLPLSNITGESSAVDYQDCGLSPSFLTGESPWDSNFEASCPQARDKAKMRYNEKKKTRILLDDNLSCYSPNNATRKVGRLWFGKQIRYASRKARADTRKRVKGRFVKAGEAYDYDPVGARNC